MNKIFSLFFSILLFGGIVEAQFPMNVKVDSLEMRINKMECDKFHGTIRVEVSVRSIGKDIEQRYSELNGRVYAAFAVGENHDYIHIDKSIDKYISPDIWVKVGVFEFNVDTAMRELTTLRFGLSGGRDKYTWFDFNNVPIAWSENVPVRHLGIKAESLLPQGYEYDAITSLVNVDGLSVVGNAQNGDLAVAVLAGNGLRWSKCVLLDGNGMRYEMNERDLYKQKDKYKPREQNLNVNGIDCKLSIIYLEFDKSQKFVKYVYLKHNNGSLNFQNVPIQWVTPKKKSVSPKSGGTRK